MSQSVFRIAIAQTRLCTSIAARLEEQTHLELNSVEREDKKENDEVVSPVYRVRHGNVLVKYGYMIHICTLCIVFQINSQFQHSI